MHLILQLHIIIGEIHRLNNNYIEAIAYEKAIEIGKAKNAVLWYFA